MMLRSLLLGAAAALLGACAQSEADAPIADQWRAQPLTVTAVTFPEATVGRLRFRGGLHIMGETREEFGGWSGLEVLDDACWRSPIPANGSKRGWSLMGMAILSGSPTPEAL